MAEGKNLLAGAVAMLSSSRSRPVALQRPFYANSVGEYRRINIKNL